MSDIALAAILAITILIARIELAAGVVVGNVFTIAVPDWLSFIGSAHLPRRGGGRRVAVPARVEGEPLDRSGVVRGAVPGRHRLWLMDGWAAARRPAEHVPVRLGAGRTDPLPTSSGCVYELGVGRLWRGGLRNVVGECGF